ncbi:MAG: DNA primase large subunit PriL [Candidatus Bathyarchaeota archaeon]|jgi:DNA primase large subunit|nr:DNA primase large subunit PriL [Candidatus Bathyarchaeota archaeon A05DMB-5]MDH7557302.1 DNA primase large subunit PriL [Candidatus Bathyarchaeota archaeon]
MQVTAAKFTLYDLAKYPFLKETTEYVKKLDLKIQDLTSPEFAEILKRAETRVEEAILFALVSRDLRKPEVEILSFPVATMLAIATENSFIKKRYALAEAEQVLNDMQDEPKEKIMAIAQNFEWKLEINRDNELPYEFALHFTDYLKNTTHLREKEWKLINCLLSGGKVYLNKNKIVRLLKEEVRKYIEKRLEIKEAKFPEELSTIAEKLKKLTLERIGKMEMEGFPKNVVQEAFPPCIDTLYKIVSSGRHLSHIGRFTLTSFLVNIGMSSESVIELFRNFSDFNERLTRYQVEHIAGERGSRTQYTSPKCETLKTHNVCTNPDALCEKIRHPLAYYRRKAKKVK